MRKMAQESIVNLEDRDIGIIAPHGDDEFIGCHRIFDIAGNNIKHVVFFSDNSLQTAYRDQSTVSYIKQRAKESDDYLNRFAPNCETSLLEIPDGLSQQEYQDKCFPLKTINQINDNIVRNLSNFMDYCDIVFFPALDTLHPTHLWCHAMSLKYLKMSKKDCVAYSTHELFEETLPVESYKKKTSIGYTNVYAHPKGLKQQLFESYYPSQAKRFASQNMFLQDHERYVGSVDIEIHHSYIADILQ